MLADLLARPRRRTSIVMLCDPNEAAEVNQIREQIAALRYDRSTGWTHEVAKLKTEMDGKLSAAESWEFHFASIGAQAVEGLEAKHPPTPKQQLEHRADNGADSRLTTNQDTFPQVLLAACMTGVTKPDGSDAAALTLDEISVLFASDAWTSNDKVRMFWAAREADQTVTAVLVDDMGNV